MSKMFLVVCHTKEDVEKARQKYRAMKKFRLTFSQCVFQQQQQSKGESALRSVKLTQPYL